MLNHDEAHYLAQVTHYAQTTVAPLAAKWSLGETPTEAFYVTAAAMGLHALELPVHAGGLGHGFALKAAVCETLAAADFGIAMSLINTHNVAKHLAHSDNAEVRQTYLPRLLIQAKTACTALTEPGAGSDFAAIQTRALRCDGGWRLNGEKAWIINARHASLAIVYAQCAEPGNRDGIAAFLVDLEDAACERSTSATAVNQTSIATGGFTLRDYFAPDAHCLMPAGQAFRDILSELNGARIYVAAMCVGMLDSAVAHVHAYGQRRQTFGGNLLSHQAWRLELAKATTDLAAARSLVHQATQQIDSGEDAQLLAAQAKVFTVQTCRHHLPKLLHAMGAEGLAPTHPVARHVAGAQMAGLTDGSDEMLLERIAHLSRSRDA